ncbi:MAG: D-alanyl-D-alanine carboxypeptidase [Ruminococcus sp.]|nr:D-alanyl-D-alanine carboxypeptidase [Ruminococcus sp.]
MKKYLSAILTVLMSAMLVCGASGDARAEDFTPGYSYILLEAETLSVLEEHNAEKTVNAGYLSKLMALLLIAEDIETGKYSLETELTASQSVYGTKGAVVWLEPGDKLTVEELVKGVIIGNANDALTVLAERSEGSVESFTARMNSEAFDMGLRNTAFYSPHGYYDEREYTTAHDMAVICASLAEYGFLEPYFRTWRDFIKEGQTELVSENTLARTYDRHIGFKVSHSEKSGYCIAEGGRSEDGTTYIAVVLSAPDEETSFAKAKELLKKGFSGYKVTTPGFLDEFLRPLRVKNGRENAVELELETQNTIVIPVGAVELSQRIVIPEYINAPVKKGARIGTVGFYNGDTLVYETAIVTKNDVKKVSLGYIFKELLLNLIEK